MGEDEKDSEDVSLWNKYTKVTEQYETQIMVSLQVLTILLLVFSTFVASPSSFSGLRDEIQEISYELDQLQPDSIIEVDTKCYYGASAEISEKYDTTELEPGVVYRSIEVTLTADNAESKLNFRANFDRDKFDLIDYSDSVDNVNIVDSEKTVTEYSSKLSEGNYTFISAENKIKLTPGSEKSFWVILEKKESYSDKTNDYGVLRYWTEENEADTSSLYCSSKEL